jgi:hypothetical protein
VRHWKILHLDELGGQDLHLLNMEHHSVQMNLHSVVLGARFGEEDGATRNELGGRRRMQLTYGPGVAS